MQLHIVTGDITEQPVEAIVNAWNRNDILKSVAFPLIGAGSGGGSPERILDIMQDEFSRIDYDLS